MPVIDDEEFGKITVRRSARATQVRIRLAPDGRLRASLPVYAPMFLVKRLIKNSRHELRKLVGNQQDKLDLVSGMQIGKSHTLIVRERQISDVRTQNVNQQIIIDIPSGHSVNDPKYSLEIRQAIIKALRRESKSYLPRRLRFLADKYGYDYDTVRFSHASSRWGSCSTSGTISLNIALMKIPFELIDYVLLHELAHTKEMNHSGEFWQLVFMSDPHYEKHRRMLKMHSTNI